MKSLFSPSWKTSIGGVVAFGSIFFQQLHYLFDGDPKTVMSVETIIAAFGILYASLNARDNNVSTEQVRG